MGGSQCNNGYTGNPLDPSGSSQGLSGYFTVAVPTATWVYGQEVPYGDYIPAHWVSGWTYQTFNFNVSPSAPVLLAQNNDPNKWVVPVFQKGLDKTASKVIPASPWKTVEGEINCFLNYVNDVTQELNYTFTNEGPNPNASANMASCMQNVGNGMTKPF
jgi:hypothetical protein